MNTGPCQQFIRSTAMRCLLIAGLAALTLPFSHVRAQSDDRTEHFVPADQLDAIFDRTSGVLLPKEEYRRLLELAESAEQEASETPADILVRSAEYHVSPAGNQALVTVTLVMQQFVDGWQTVAIPTGQLHLEQARIGDTDAVIGRRTASVLQLFHDTAGQFTVELTFSTALGKVGSDRAVGFDVIHNTPVRLTADCPAGQHLLLDGRRVQRPQAIDEAASYALPIGMRNKAELQWTSRQDDAATKTLVFARSDLQVRLSSDTLRWRTRSRIAVFGGTISRLTATVPATLEITAVESTGLESWELSDHPDRNGHTLITLTWRQPFDADRLISISGVSPVSAEEATGIPPLVYNEVTAHSGQLLITQEDQLRLTVSAGDGIRQLTPDAAPQTDSSTPVFDYWLQDYQLSVAVRPRDRELFSQVSSALGITDTQASLNTTVTIETLNAPLFEIRLTIPQGWQLLSVADPNGQTVTWRTQDNNGSIIVEPAVPVPAGGLLSLQLTMTREIADPVSPQQIELPVVLAPDTSLVAGRYTISSTPDLQVAPTEIRGLVPTGEDSDNIVFESQGTAVSGQLSVVRRPARLSARSEIRCWMDSRQTTTATTVTVDVINGRTRQLQIRLPESTGEDLRFHVDGIGPVPGYDTDAMKKLVPPQIRLTEAKADDPVDGVRLWHLTFDRRFAGSVTLTTMIRQPREGANLSAPSVAVVGAIHQEGLIAFEASPDQQLREADNQAVQGLRPADPSMVTSPDAATGRRIARVYQFVRPAWSASLTETRFETQPVPTAVCRSVRNVSLLGDTGAVQRSCHVQLHSIGVQTLRFTLPGADDAFLWSTVLNGEAVEVRRDGDDYLVSIPTGDDRTDHELKLLFESRSATDAAFTATHQAPVRFAVDIESAASSPIDILEQTWQVQYPSDTLLLGHAGSYHPLAPLTQPGWLQSLSGELRRPHRGQLSFRGLVAAVILGTLFLLTALVARGHRTTATVLGICAGLATTMWLLFPSVQQARQAADLRQEAVRQSAGGELRSSATMGRLSASDAKAVEEEARASGSVTLSRSTESEEAADRLRMFDSLQPASPATELFEGQLAEPIQGESDGDAVNDFSFGVRIDESSVQALGLPESASGDDRQLARRRGSARLSVRVDLQQPDGYQSVRFRSLGTDSGGLSLVMQTAGQISSLRMLAAALVLIFCWMQRQRADSVKLATLISLLLTAIALVPLTPNHWQAVLDGIVAGTLLAIVLWPVGWLVHWIQNSRCCRRGMATAAVLLAALTSPRLMAEEPVDAASTIQAPDEQPAPKAVLPYTPGEPPLTADQVFVPRKEFLKLYALAHPGELQPQAGPATALVTAAYYRSDERRQVQDAQWTQRFQGRIVIRTFQDRATQVRLPFHRVALKSARLNEQEAVVTRSGHSFTAHIPSAGLHILDVDFEASADIDASGGTVSLTLSEVPAGLMTFELPEADFTARVNGSSSGFRQNGRTIQIPLIPEKQLRIEWMPDTSRGTSDTIVHSVINSTLEINDQGLTLVAVNRLNCRLGTMTESELTLPVGYSVRSVEGSDLAGWSVEGSDESPRLKVIFRSEISTQTSYRLTLYAQQTITTDRRSLPVPIPEPPGVSRSTGTICILAGSELDIQTESLSGVSQINPGDAELNGHESTDTRPVLAWRFNRHPAEITIRASRIRDRLRATVLNGVQLESERQRWTSSVTLNIQGAPRRRVDIRIPATFLAFEVDCTDLADWYITEPADSSQPLKTLSVQLKTARTGRVRVVIQGQDQRSADRMSEQLTVPQVVDAHQQTTQLSLWQDVATDISGFSGEHWTSIVPDRTSAELRALRSDAPGISFSSNQTVPQPVTVRFRRADASALCESVTVTNVTSTSIEQTLALSWRISRSAADTFSVELPADIAESLDFRIAGLRQEERTPLDNGLIRITFHLQYPVSERFFAAGTGAVPLPATGEFRSIPVTFVADSNGRSPMTIASQSHFWVIVNQSGGVLEAVQPEIDTDEITASQLSTSIPDSLLEQSVAIRRITEQQPGSAWHIRFPEAEETAPAVIAIARHVTVLAEDGSWRSVHTLQVRNESRQFLPVRLPENSRPLFCLVKDKPTRIVSRTTEDGVLHLIPLPQSGIVSAPFEVRFGLEGTLPQDAGSMQTAWQNKSVAMPVPQFPEYRDNKELGVTVARNTWSVYVPEAWSSVSDDNPRRTNVLPADAAVLEDTVVMSSLETSRELLQEARQTKDRLVRETLIRELSSQLQGLKTQRANAEQTQTDQRNTVQDVEHWLRDNTSQSDDASQPAQGGNLYLNEQALLRNSVIVNNNDAIVAGNDIAGIQSFGSTLPGVSGSGGRSFGFTIQDKERFRPARKKAVGKPDQAGQNQPESGRQQRSLLIQSNSGSGVEVQNGDGIQFNRFHSPQTANGEDGIRIQQALPNQPAAPADQAAAIERNSNVVDMTQTDAGHDEITIAAAAPVSAGLLSLQFEIPTDGQRLDFVRASGNAALTLKIRSAQSLQWMKGIIWAVVCLLTLWLILRALQTGRAERMSGVLAVMFTLVGLAGWLLLSGGPGVLALIMAIVSACVFCVRQCRSNAAQTSEA